MSIAAHLAAEEWISGHGVDRALLRVGDAPSGYTLHVDGAGRSDFNAGYRRPGSSGLRLTVERSGQDARRTDWHGCPVPLGETVHCADDGGGRLLVTYRGSGGDRQELRLLRAGLVYTVALPESAAERSARRPPCPRDAQAGDRYRTGRARRRTVAELTIRQVRPVRPGADSCPNDSPHRLS
ncbi:hypothetical protein [Streptomyces sp. YGL11-2]|uniref:hypothetical protein n=1 Tax=Streptomyces sp. YGL11-2 TaxID=3414028 RepID=UPI003CE82046